MSIPRGVVIGTAVLLAGFLLLWLFHESPKAYLELLILFGVVALAYHGGRAAWKWFQSTSPQLSSLGLLVSLGVATSGWVLVGVAKLVVHAVGDSYAMVIIAPLLIIAGLLAGLAGLGAALVGVAVVARAVTRPAKGSSLVMLGGAVSILLNLTFVWTYVKAVLG